MVDRAHYRAELIARYVMRCREAFDLEPGSTRGDDTPRPDETGAKPEALSIFSSKLNWKALIMVL